MNKLNVAMLAILSAGVLMTMGIAATAVFAGGSNDHDDHSDSKHCDKNDINNCYSSRGSKSVCKERL
jgi:hypothetical protein